MTAELPLDERSMPGPCVICGDRNYPLSCGGPTICPKCDCGIFDATTVEKQARVIADLRSALAKCREETVAAVERLVSERKIVSSHSNQLLRDNYDMGAADQRDSILSGLRALASTGEKR